MSNNQNLVKKLELLTPGFIGVWNEWLEEDINFGDGEEITEHTIFLEYFHFISDNIDNLEVKQKELLFEYIEESLTSNDDNLSNAVATCFLENLAQMYIKYQPENYFPFLGEKSKVYSREWDKFNGRKTKGLY